MKHTGVLIVDLALLIVTLLINKVYFGVVFLVSYISPDIREYMIEFKEVIQVLTVTLIFLKILRDLFKKKKE